MKTYEHYDGDLRDERLPWTKDHARCQSCGYEWIAVRTIGSDFTKLECLQCHAFDSELIDEDEEL